MRSNNIQYLCTMDIETIAIAGSSVLSIVAIILSGLTYKNDSKRFEWEEADRKEEEDKDLLKKLGPLKHTIQTYRKRK